MPQRNFGDPSYEPTDEDLAELIHEAFADVALANQRAQLGLREQVRARRALVLARLAEGSSTAGRVR